VSGGRCESGIRLDTKARISLTQQDLLTLSTQNTAFFLILFAADTAPYSLTAKHSTFHNTTSLVAILVPVRGR